MSDGPRLHNRRIFSAAVTIRNVGDKPGVPYCFLNVEYYAFAERRWIVEQVPLRYTRWWVPAGAWAHVRGPARLSYPAYPKGTEEQWDGDVRCYNRLKPYMTKRYKG